VTRYTFVVLRKLRHHFLLILFVLLPLHALFVTVGTRLIEGYGHAPMPLLAIWKEVLIAFIFLVGIVELAMADWKSVLIMIKGGRWKFRLDAPTWCILGLLAVAIILFINGAPSSLTQFVFGFKYDFIPLIFFLLLAWLPWDQDFLEKRMYPAVFIIGGIVAAYGILTFFLPQGFFTTLGYSDAHSIYAPGSSLSAFQHISNTGIRRIQSTFSGPNQFGLWLLIPWSVGLCVMLSEGALYRPSSSPSLRSGFAQDDTARRRRNIPFLLLIAFALLLTFSRSAWIAAFVITVIAISVNIHGKRRMHILMTLFSIVILAIITLMATMPSLIERSISNRHHIERVREGIVTMIQNPLGFGLGSAGPASNRVSDTCLYFDEGADTSWAKDRSDLCLFIGRTQVQPTIDQKECHCPLLPENWYIQIGLELGILGFALFLALCFIILKRLSIINVSPAFLAFLGISIASLFLHAWEDSAVAYTVWGLVGVLLSSSESVATDESRGLSTHSSSLRSDSFARGKP